MSMWSSTTVRADISDGLKATLFNSASMCDDTPDLISRDLENLYLFRTNLRDGHWVSYADIVPLGSSIQGFLESSIKIVGDEFIDISSVVVKLKNMLGLPNKDVAAIFRVTRQTLHSYTKESVLTARVSEKVLERSKSIAALIERLDPIFETSPGSLAKNYYYQGSSLFDLMIEEEFNQEKIFKVSAFLSEKIKEAKSKSNVSGNNNTLYALTKVS
ncbi:hypothetical protein [Zobellella sp. DQSA1]|uniref:hypothetical protein n=1 Tax=Zobellella sp. DQSA1 TaxID=3342386 RepID=UPI0035BF948F